MPYIERIVKSENNMYGLNRLNNLRTLFTAAAAAQLSRRSPPARSIPFLHASPPASTAGIGYFVGVGEGRRINDDCFKRKLLPPELSRNVVTLTCESSAPGGICDVYVVGTAHGTTESCQQVQAVVEFLKPQVVFLELCPSRQHILLPHNSKFDSEFRAAYEEAMEYGGKVILGDRPIQGQHDSDREITMWRQWVKLSIWHKAKVLHSVSMRIIKTLMEMDRVILLTVAKELKDIHFDMVSLAMIEMFEFPNLMETFIHERDQYMSASLLKVAREHSSVVAVVGEDHLPGIRKNWKQPIEVEQLLSMPYENKLITAISIGATFAGVAFVYGVAIISGVAIVYGIYLSITI